MNTDLKLIKKHYGEDMMHYARDNFPIILEKEGELSKLFLDNFAESKSLYEDLKENEELIKFKNYIFNLFSDNKNINSIKINESPSKLMSKAGYNLYECKTEEDIQFFKKYYSKGEELCTFNGNRLDKCYVFFAVKKDVDKINRKDFKNPEREDLYGTSVISIQFTKDEMHTLSIKNRYNHRVNNPDATFKNNLDNIIPGLTNSFEEYYGYKQAILNKEDFKEFVRANDGKFYKYNHEQFGVYFCRNNVVIQYGTIKKLEKEKYIIMDDVVLDLQYKEFVNYSFNNCSFTSTIKNINKIEVEKHGINKLIIFKTDKEDIKVEIDKNGEIIGYINNNITEIKDNFLDNNKKLQYIEMNNVTSIGNAFLLYNKELKSLNINKVEEIGDNFLGFSRCSLIKTINFPKLEIIGKGFMLFCEQGIEEIYLPNVKSIGDEFCRYLRSGIEILDFPNLEIMGEWFMYELDGVSYINIPKIIKLSSFFLSTNQAFITKLNLDNCKYIGRSVMTRSNVDLNNANLSNVEKIEKSFLTFSDTNSDVINMPKVESIANNVLSYENNIKYVNLPMLKHVGKSFLKNANKIQDIDINNLESIEKDSLKGILGKNILKYNLLNEQDKIIKIKECLNRRKQLNKLLNLKKTIIQNIYAKTKILKK